MSLRAAIYARISSDPQGLRAGVDRQEHECRALAVGEGWEVAHTFVDNDLSAYSGRKRPGYEALLDALKKGEVDVLIAWHTDRLHRQPRELESFIDVIDAHSVKVRTVVSGELDLTTSDGRMVARIAGAVARRESEHRGERVRAASLQRAEAGQRHGSVPYGWRKDGTLDLDQADVVRRMGETFLATQSLRAVVRELDQFAVPTPRSDRRQGNQASARARTARPATTSAERQWSPSQVRKILLRPSNAGLRSYKGEIIGQGQWEPLMAEDTWRAVVALLRDEGRAQRGRRSGQRLLTGSIFCGVCAAPMRGSSNTDRKRQRWLTYQCTASARHPNRRADAIEAIAEAAVLARLDRSPDLLQPSRQDSTKEDLREAQALRQRLEALAVDFAEGMVTRAQLQSGSSRLRSKLEAVEHRLSRVETSQALAPFRAGRTTQQVWEGLDIVAKKAVIATLARVEVHPGRAGGRRFDMESVRLQWL